MKEKITTKRKPIALLMAFVMSVVMFAGLHPQQAFAADGNGCYSLKGAVYGVYKTKAAATAATNANRGTPVAVLTTKDEAGNLLH